MAASGLEPDIDDVSLLAELRLTTARAPGPRRKNFLHAARVPGIGTLASEQRHHGAVDLFGFKQFPTGFTEKHCDGHAPHALPGDTPVGARRDHVGNALLAPGRHPLHFLDLLQGTLAERAGADHSLHRNEPLLGGTEDHRIMASPAMGIGVLELALSQQPTAGLEEFDNGLVGLKDRLAIIFGKSVAEAAGFVDVRALVQFIFLARVEVVGAVRWRGMDSSGSLVDGDVVAKDPENLPVEKRMSEGGEFQFAAREAR